MYARIHDHSVSMLRLEIAFKAIQQAIAISYGPYVAYDMAAYDTQMRCDIKYGNSKVQIHE